MLARALLALSVAGGAALGCEPSSGDDDEGGEPACVTRSPSACTPLYEPSFERVFTETLEPRCATGGGACHGESGARGAGGGLVIGDMTSTHAALVDHGFVVPGDAACSALLVRLDIDDSGLRMPPGAEPLEEAERCAVAQWIEQGAEP